jgi:hypothetical protein
VIAIAAAVLSIALLARGPAPEAPTPTPAPMRLTLKNGTVYVLREPPRISGSRVIFTTMDGRAFSMDQSEIEAVGVAPRPTPAPKRYDSGDSHALGAIARQEREHNGKKAEVAPGRTVKHPTPTPSHRRKPRPSPTAPAAARTPPG